MKKYISVCMAVLLLAVTLLSGCAGGSSDETGDTGTPNHVDSDAVHLTFYAREFEEWSNAHMRELVERFNAEHTDIQVDLKSFASDVYVDGLTVARENGKAPDVYMLEYGSVYTHAKYGYAAPLNDLLPQSALDDLFENVRSMVSYDDKVYAYPWTLEPATLLFCRTDLLEACGVSTIPATWDELYEACAAVKPSLNLGQYCIGLPSGSVELAWTTYGLQYNTCGKLAVDDSWMVSNIEDPGYKEICRFLYNIYSNEYAPSAGISSEGYTDIVSALCEDKLAMCVGGSWSIAEIYQDYPEMADKISVSAIPTIDGDTQKTTSGNGGWTFCISEDSGKKEAAAEFIQWLFVDDPARAGEYFLKAYHSKSPTSNALKEYLEANPSEVDPAWAQVVNEVASQGIPEAQYPWDIAFAVGQMFEAIQVGAASSSFEDLYNSASATAKSSIDSVMSRTSYEGNPRYEQEGSSQ